MQEEKNNNNKRESTAATIVTPPTTMTTRTAKGMEINESVHELVFVEHVWSISIPFRCHCITLPFVATTTVYIPLEAEGRQNIISTCFNHIFSTAVHFKFCVVVCVRVLSFSSDLWCISVWLRYICSYSVHRVIQSNKTKKKRSGAIVSAAVSSMQNVDLSPSLSLSGVFVNLFVINSTATLNMFLLPFAEWIEKEVQNCLTSSIICRCPAIGKSVKIPHSDRKYDFRK